MVGRRTRRRKQPRPNHRASGGLRQPFDDRPTRPESGIDSLMLPPRRGRSHRSPFGFLRRRHTPSPYRRRGEGARREDDGGRSALRGCFGRRVPGPAFDGSTRMGPAGRCQRAPRSGRTARRGGFPARRPRRDRARERRGKSGGQQDHQAAGPGLDTPTGDPPRPDGFFL